MVNQVGSPAMFEGNRFLPLTGMPIWNRARKSTTLAVWLPEPLTVATVMLKSLVMGSTLSLDAGSAPSPGSARASSGRAAAYGGTRLVASGGGASTPVRMADGNGACA